MNRCSRLQEDPNPTLSCGRVCSRPLSCGKHVCMQTCHSGDCAECTEQELVSCYCGKDTKSVPCGEGKPIDCATLLDGVAKLWRGRYGCDAPCGQPYACGLHACEEVSIELNPSRNHCVCGSYWTSTLCSQECHPPSLQPDVCPSDPSIITTCPCGKHSIESLPNGFRKSCTDRIATCGSTCGKEQLTCSHACLSECHIGPCPPCTVSVNVACRCGQTMRYISCSLRHQQLEAGQGEILCETKCGGQRHCGRHACSRVCCPLAAVSQTKKGGKAKRRGAVDAQVLEDEDVEGWHTCDLVRCLPLMPG